MWNSSVSMVTLRGSAVDSVAISAGVESSSGSTETDAAICCVELMLGGNCLPSGGNLAVIRAEQVWLTCSWRLSVIGLSARFGTRILAAILSSMVGLDHALRGVLET